MKKLLIASTAALLFSVNASYAQENQAGNEEMAFNSNGEFSSGTTTSNGNCSYKGHIVRVSVYPEGENSYVYFRNYARSHVLYQAKVHDERLLNAAFQGLNGSVHVQINTDRFCAGNEGSGKRYVGYIERLVLNP